MSAATRYLVATGDCRRLRPMLEQLGVDWTEGPWQKGIRWFEFAEADVPKLSRVFA